MRTLVLALALLVAPPTLAIEPFVGVGDCDVPNQLELTAEDPDGEAPDGFVALRATFMLPPGADFLALTEGPTLTSGQDLFWSQWEDLRGAPVLTVTVFPIVSGPIQAFPPGVYAIAHFKGVDESCEPILIEKHGIRPDFDSGRFGESNLMAANGFGFSREVGPPGGVALGCSFLDANENGAVDMSELADCFLAQGSNTVEDLNAGDINCNGAIDIGDLTAVFAAQGRACSPGPIICPETSRIPEE